MSDGLMGVGLVMEGVGVCVGVCAGVDVGVDEDDVGEVAVGEGVAFAVFLLFEGVGLDVGDDGVGVGEVAVGEGVAAFAVFSLLEGAGLDVGDDEVESHVWSSQAPFSQVASADGVYPVSHTNLNDVPDAVLAPPATEFVVVKLAVHASAAVLEGEGVEGFRTHVLLFESQSPLVHVATFEGVAVYPVLHENVYVFVFFVPLPPATEFSVSKGVLQFWPQQVANFQKTITINNMPNYSMRDDVQSIVLNCL